jgi:predicted RNA binding protein YcfA (HicA-like mRNA interferase family)
MNNLSPAIRQILKKAGFVWFRTGKGDHEIWKHTVNGKRVTVDAKVRTKHSANKILRDAGLPKAF